jgi:protein-tyrosine kinase
MSERALTATRESETGAPQKGWLAGVRSDARRALEVRNRFSRRRLGEIMVIMGLIDGPTRDAVLERQGGLGLPFGECCVRLKLIDAAGLARALAWQFGYVYPASGAGPFGKDLVVISDPFGSYADAIRAVAGRLTSRWLAAGRNALAIVSTESGEGRSHVAANLAVSLAQGGATTLLIDADFRRPRQHLIFGVPQHPGLSRLLCGFAPQDLVHRIGRQKNLSVLSSGPLPPNPSELLGRNELTTLMIQAKEAYDIVLVDTPAAGRCSDAESIASAAGGALIVARKSRTRQRKLRGLAECLTRNGVQVAGTLMNVF